MTYHKTGATYVDFLRSLKRLGFTRDYDSHAGGVRQVSFSREYPELKRFVWVEFSGPYPKPGHIHSMRLGRGELNQYGRGSSIVKHGLPIDFKTVIEMLELIIVQITAEDEDAKAR